MLKTCAGCWFVHNIFCLSPFLFLYISSVENSSYLLKLHIPKYNQLAANPRRRLSLPAQVMSPFTPFFTEQMYQNLRRCQPPGEAPESVHYCDFPTAQEPYAGDAQIQLSVERMQTVIELSRTIRLGHALYIDIVAKNDASCVILRVGLSCDAFHEVCP